MQIREIATVEFILVSSDSGLSVEQALEDNYVFVDWGLSFGLDHRRTFPDAPEAITRVTHAKMALEYISLIGGSAYLPKRMIDKDIELGLLHEVADAPAFTRQAYATFPVRSTRIELIEETLQLVRSE
jgi:DNA-binding transcriptional LysR family regulator